MVHPPVKKHFGIRNKKTNCNAVAESLFRFWYRFIFSQQNVIRNGLGAMLFRENTDGSLILPPDPLKIQPCSGWKSRIVGDNCLFTMDRFAVSRLKTPDSAVPLNRMVLQCGSVKQKNHLPAAECKYRKMPFRVSMQQRQMVVPHHFCRLACYLTNSTLSLFIPVTLTKTKMLRPASMRFPHQCLSPEKHR